MKNVFTALIVWILALPAFAENTPQRLAGISLDDEAQTAITAFKCHCENSNGHAETINPSAAAG